MHYKMRTVKQRHIGMHLLQRAWFTIVSVNSMKLQSFYTFEYLASTGALIHYHLLSLTQK